MTVSQILNDDCFNVFPLIQDKSIDLILCDLPYGVTKASHDKKLPRKKLWEEYKRIIKDNGAILLFAQGLFAAELMISNKQMYRYDLVWKKGERVSGYLNSKKMPLRNHEQILVFYKALPTYNPQMTIGKPTHSMGANFANSEHTNRNYGNHKKDNSRSGLKEKFPKSVLNFERPHPPIHPTQKPVSLCEYLIKTFSNEGDIVLDNCMGIGTTCIAAKNCGRRYIGIEKEKEWFDIAKTYLDKETNCKTKESIFD